MYSEFELQQGAPARVSPFAANALYLLSAAGLFLVALAGQWLNDLFRALLPGAAPEVLELCVYAVYYLPFLLLPASIAIRRAGAWESARIKPVSAAQMLAVCALAVLGVFLATYLGVLWSLALEAVGFPVSGSGMQIPTTGAGLVAAVFSLGVLPGVCEELVFRGAILGSRERGGTRRAIFVSALLFAMVHGSVEGFPTQLLLGAIMGYLAFACDSIYASIAYHTVHNSALLVLAMVFSRGETVSDAAETAAMSIFEQVGGVAGVIGTIVVAAVLLAILLGALSVFDRRRRARGIVALPRTRVRSTGGARAMLVLALVIVAGLYALSIVASYLEVILEAGV